MKEKNQMKNERGIALIYLILIIILVLGVAFGAIFLIKQISNGDGSSIFNIGKNETTDTIYSFNNKNNYIAVKNKEGKYGYIDTEGNQKIDFKYNSATDFINGLAIVRNENSDEGIIDSKGNEVIKFGEFSYIYRYNESQNAISTYSNIFIATNNEGQKQLLNKDGKIVTQNSYQEIDVDEDLIYFENNGTYGLLDVNGKEILTSNTEFEVEDTYDAISVLSFDNCNKIINNISGEVLKEAVKEYYPTIDKYGEYYEVQDSIIIKNNKVVYSGDENHSIIDINEDAIVHLQGIERYDGNTVHEYNDIYYSLSSDKMILEISEDNEAVLLNKTVVYQENNELYNIDKNGNKSMIADISGKDLEYGIGTSIVVLRDEDYKYYFMNIDTKEYIKNTENSISINSLDTSYYGVIRGFYSITEYINSEKNTYIVDSNLNKISDDYTQTSNYLTTNTLNYTYRLTGKKYILLLDSNKKVGLIDEKGNKVIDFKYTGVQNSMILFSNIPAIIFTKDNGIDIYDLSKQKVILSSNESSAALYENYIKVGNQIYNYDGKLIYTE